MHTAQRLLHDDSGQDLIEYALVAAAIAFGAAAIMQNFAGDLSSTLKSMGSKITNLV